MSELPPRSAAWAFDSTPPDQELIDRAVAATLEHPYAAEARTFHWCHAVVMREPKSFLSRTKIPDAAAALDSLSDAEDVVLVSYQTSITPPEPLSGFGKTFDFVLHPKTFVILATGTGTWRS